MFLDHRNNDEIEAKLQPDYLVYVNTNSADYFDKNYKYKDSAPWLCTWKVSIDPTGSKWKDSEWRMQFDANVKDVTTLFRTMSSSTGGDIHEWNSNGGFKSITADNSVTEIQFLMFPNLDA